MKFTKGTPKPPTSGRKKGTKNKTTEEIRKAFQQIISMKCEELESDLKTMSPFQQWQILDKLNNKIMPNLQKSDDTINHSGNIQVSINFEDSLGLNDNDTESEDIDI